MDLLLILTYAAICIAAFKLFRIPLNKWTVPTAVLGGIILIGSLVLLMNYNHPFSRQVRQVYVVTPIVPEVRGTVVEVPVTPNTVVTKGEVLFRIESSRYQARVDRLEAELVRIRQDLKGAASDIKAAEARVASAQAERDEQFRTYERYRLAGDAMSRQARDVQRDTYRAAEARLEEARSQLETARSRLDASVDGDDPQVAELRARLREARFELDSTVVRAPTAGYATQLALRPGMMAAPLPLRPVMSFVHEEPHDFVAAFRQQSLLRLENGYEAELAFDALPGRVFAAQVIEVLPTIAESQFQAGGELQGSNRFAPTESRVFVKLRVQADPELASLPIGVNAQAAVYSHHFHHVAIMRKMLLRMLSWQHYLYLDH